MHTNNVVSSHLSKLECITRGKEESFGAEWRTLLEFELMRKGPYKIDPDSWRSATVLSSSLKVAHDIICGHARSYSCSSFGSTPTRRVSRSRGSVHWSMEAGRNEGQKPARDTSDAVFEHRSGRGTDHHYSSGCRRQGSARRVGDSRRS